MWHQRVPERYPEVIVQAADADDIIAGLRYAKANGLKVSIVSGGHSFAANHLRDGSVLLDVSRLDHATINAENPKHTRPTSTPAGCHRSGAATRTARLKNAASVESGLLTGFSK